VVSVHSSMADPETVRIRNHHQHNQYEYQLGFCPTEIQLGIVDLAPVLPTGTRCEQSGRRVRNYESGRHLLKTCLPTTPEGPETRPGWRFRRYAPGKWWWTITTTDRSIRVSLGQSEWQYVFRRRLRTTGSRRWCIRSAGPGPDRGFLEGPS